MPTPFTHLAIAHRFSQDPEVPDYVKTLVREHRGAFLLGSIAPDAQYEGGLRRDGTHFFAYKYPVKQAPNTAMLARYPELRQVETSDRLAFLAGYLGHLKVDEVWWTDMMYPYFWRDSALHDRFFMLHVLLMIMDERDYVGLAPDIHSALQATTPRDWLPFLSDQAIVAWRDKITPQIAPQGMSLSLRILGNRVPQGPDGLEAMLRNETRLASELWAHLPRTTLTQVENRLYFAMRQTILDTLER